MDRELKTDLIKVNLVVMGAAISALQFDINVNRRLLIIGIFSLLSVILILYVSLMPDFYIAYFETQYRQESTLDTILLITISSILFVVLGFVGPTLDKQLSLLDIFSGLAPEIPDISGILSPTFAYLILGIIRVQTLKSREDRDFTNQYLIQLIAGLVLLLLISAVVVAAST